MAMFAEHPKRPAAFQRFEREVPAWFRDAKLGIFVHWGAYAVPAWAEPIGPLGTIDPETWFAHNPYAEWYYNTIRIEGSPAALHHAAVHGGRPYDDFLDAWDAAAFDADSVLGVFARAGARYVVPTTKHHDGITLWDAPRTGDRNTVRRGPRRDLVGEFADAARRHGVRFGAYYSGGLDWWFADSPPIISDDMQRPNDAEYAAYAADHVIDLIDRYRPDLLWGDIDWPDAGKHDGERGLARVFERFYDAVPDGVVNDRWGETHWDYRTSEYEQGHGVEAAEPWENCRGIGFSFGVNQLEDERHVLDGPAAVRHLVDVVARGGNLLLNVGLDAAGRIPPLQRATLDALGAWNAADGAALFGSRPAPHLPPSDDPWVRWVSNGEQLTAFVLGDGEVRLRGAARLVAADSVRGRIEGDDLIVTVSPADGYPRAVTFQVR